MAPGSRILIDGGDPAELLANEQIRKLCQFGHPLAEKRVTAASCLLRPDPSAHLATTWALIVQPDTMVNANAGKLECPKSLKKAPLSHAQRTPASAGLVEVGG